MSQKEWRSGDLPGWEKGGQKRCLYQPVSSHFVHKTDSELLVKAVGTTGSVAPDLFKSIAVVVITLPTLIYYLVLRSAAELIVSTSATQYCMHTYI